MPTLDTFHLFPKLPTEIRLQIWRLCLPSRVVEIDHQIDEVTWGLNPPCPCPTNWRISCTNSVPPLISNVCTEARSVAGETGSPQPINEGERFSNSMIERPHPWLDTKRDYCVHLNWDPDVDIEWQSYDWGDPVRSLMEYAARARSKQASIRVDLLQTFQYRDIEEPHDHYRWTRAGLAELIRERDSWTVVVLPPVVVHGDVKGCKGLFGLLGDARVQIVDADDQRRIDEFLALGEEENVSIGAGFGAEELEKGKEELKETVEAVFREERMPVMRPAVMFRLCTRCK